MAGQAGTGNRPGHLRLISGTTVRGPQKRKHALGTKHGQEVEGFAFRDTYRTQCQEFNDFIGPATGPAGGPILTQNLLIDNQTDTPGANALTVTAAAQTMTDWTAPSAGTITGVSFGYITPKGVSPVVTQSVSNYFTITSLTNNSANTLLSVSAHRNTTDTNALAINNGNNLTANVNYPLTLGAGTTVNAGDVVTFIQSVTGTFAAPGIYGPYLEVAFTPSGSASPGLSGTIVGGLAGFSSGVGTPVFKYNLTNPGNGAPNGEALLQLDATSGAETAAASWGDILNFVKWDAATPILGDGPFFEARVKIGATTPVGANDTVVIGVATAANATLASITEYAWFRLIGNMNVVLETNDGTNVNTAFNPVLGPITLTAGQYYDFTIDFSDPTNVCFWITNVDSANAKNTEVFDIFLGTMNMGALTAAMGFQPFFAVQRSSGTDNVDVIIDFYSARWTRL
jgi:hypothetical protein